jgi:hypothetical protein
MNEQNSTKKTMLLTACMSMGFMISPMSLEILGNSVGSVGYLLFWSLLLCAIINLWTAQLYTRFHHPAVSAESNKNSKNDSFGILPTFQIASQVPFSIGASTLILATTGYAFNEIFFYWFPNLLFSVCFLILIVVVNLINRSVTRGFQALAVSLFVGSMLLLLILGVFNWEKADLENQSMAHMPYLEWRPMLLVFWLFMAAELSIYQDKVLQNSHAFKSSLIMAFFACFVIFLLWGYTSLNFASPERLAESTVPHSLVARAISGENGRKILGIAIFAGSFASVNTLLAGVASVEASMAGSRQIFSMLNRKVLGSNLAMMILFIGILCMLLTGMAGKEITKTLTYSAFYIWLISYAGFNLVTIRQLYYSVRNEKKVLMLPGFSAAFIYLAGAIILIATDPDVSKVITFIAGFFIISIFITMVFRKYYGATA